MPETVSLGLPLLVAEQAQKHVTHNEALRAIDAIVQLAVKDRDLATPPGSPAEGDRYIVAASPTGVWTGHAADVAVWQGGAWDFHDPHEGWRCWVDDENVFLIFDGSAWVDWGAALGVLQNLSLLGIGTTADPTNPFSAKLNKALWTAKTAAEGGDGDLRYTMNKEATSDVVSLLFQKGFSERAEIGLIGDDDLSFKTSPDGSTFNVGLALDKTTGGVRFLASQVDIASATTCDIGAAASLKVRITGTTAITSFGTSIHAVKVVLFNGALTLTHNATSLILPGGANITTAAGDCAIATSDGSGNWRVRHYAKANGKAVIGATSTDITDSTATGRSALTAASAAALATAAGVGTGDSPTHVALTLSNGQLVFPASQVPSAGANTLDDYEEGTFTAALNFATTNPTGLTYSTQSASYTKIGNTVFVKLILVTSSMGSGGAGNAQITGFPFTNGSIACQIVPVINNVTFGSGYTFATLQLNTGATAASLYEMGSAKTTTNLVYADLGAGFYIAGSGSYSV